MAKIKAMRFHKGMVVGTTYSDTIRYLEELVDETGELEFEKKVASLIPVQWDVSDLDECFNRTMTFLGLRQDELSQEVREAFTLFVNEAEGSAIILVYRPDLLSKVKVDRTRKQIEKHIADRARKIREAHKPMNPAVDRDDVRLGARRLNK